jgi:hypothetical protein
MKPRLNILPSHHINEQLWNNSINKNFNGLIYSTTSYLNTLSENWHGLIVNDYETVMPLPWKKKAGIRYCYTPPFIQQLGITGNTEDSILEEIVPAIGSFVSYGDFQFNFSNAAIQDIIPVSSRTNLLINLSQDYSIIRLSYKQDTIENIRKAENQGLMYEKEYRTDAITLYQELYQKRMPQVQQKEYSRFSGLCETLYKQGQCITRTVTDTQEVLSTAVLLKDEKRIYNIMNATSAKGRLKEANYFLFDQLIHEFAGTPILLDFEGSDLPGVRNFYEKFGAFRQPYFHYHFNRLPWPLQFLKR